MRSIDEIHAEIAEIEYERFLPEPQSFMPPAEYAKAQALRWALDRDCNETRIEEIARAYIKEHRL